MGRTLDACGLVNQPSSVRTLIAGILCCAIAVPAVGQAATVAYDSTGWWVKPSSGDSSTWRYSTPSPAASIGWSMGPNITGNVAWPITQFGGESKFNFVAGAIVPKVYTGFAGSNTGGPGPDTVTASGSGTSGPVAGTIWGTNYRAAWTVTASVPLGATKKSYAQAEAADPYPVTTAQLSSAGVSGAGTIDYFVPIEIQSSSLGNTGGGTIDVSYTSSSGTVTLLSVDFSSFQVVATPGSPAGLSYFLQGDVTTGPPASGSGLSPSALEAGILSGLNSNTPLSIGILWEGVNLPTADLGDGSVAKFALDTTVNDSTVPIPATMPLMLSALAGLGLFVRRKKPCGAA